MSTQTDTIVQNKIKDRAPGKYKVVMLNDDVTPMDLVIELLMKIFRHDETTAKQITMEIHNTGSGIAGVYAYEIAEQKGLEAVTKARLRGSPLKVTLEEE